MADVGVITGNGAEGAARPHARDDLGVDPLGAVVPARLLAVDTAVPSDPSGSLDNVVPFRRPRRDGAAPVVAVGTETRPAHRAVRPWRRSRAVAVIVLSVAAHAGVLMALQREPAPAASIGEVVISAEVVLGTDAAAGLTRLPSPSEAQAEPVSAADAARPTDAEPQSAEPAREPPHAETPPAAPAEAAAADPAPTLEPPPEPLPQPAAEVAPAPEPEPTIESAPQAKPQRADPPRPRTAERAKDASREPPRRAPPSPAAASGVGIGRSDAIANYHGRVAAHLARHKQYPSGARSRGQEGGASVTFGLDGGGRVTSVRLARASGVADIDLEAVAMVRRASPFPAPPTGQPMSFTVPVSFRLR